MGELCWPSFGCFSEKTPTVFCVISAPGAFEIKIEKVPFFPGILHYFLQKLQTFFLILNNLQSQKERGALIRGEALITQNTVLQIFDL